MAKDEPAVVKEYREKIRNKSIRDIVREAHKVKEEPQKEEEKPVEEKLPTEEPQEELKADIHIESTEDRKKELEDIKKAAEEAAKSSVNELKEEIQKIKESNKTDEQKKEEIKDLKANWTGVDPKTGERTPKSYDEIVEEATRIAEEKFKKFYQDQKQKELEEYKKAEETEKLEKQHDDEQKQAKLKDVQQQIEKDLNDLYSSGKLKKPKDVNDLNDPAAAELKDLFDQAATYNIKQQESGEPMEGSIAKFYFLHYKPKTNRQPAGADAPVAGAVSVPSEQPERFNYIRDIKNQSFKTILYNAKKKLQGK